MKHPTRYQLPWQVFSYPALYGNFSTTVLGRSYPHYRDEESEPQPHVTQPVAGGWCSKGQRPMPSPSLSSSEVGVIPLFLTVARIS